MTLVNLLVKLWLNVPLFNFLISWRIRNIAEDVESNYSTALMHLTGMPFKLKHPQMWKTRQFYLSTCDTYVYQGGQHEDLMCVLTLPTKTEGKDMSGKINWIHCIQ